MTSESKRRGWWRKLSPAVVLLATGPSCCFHGPEDCSRCGAIPPLAGTYSHQWQDAEASRAAADKFVLYPADWVGGGQELGPLARQRLARLAKQTGETGGPFLIVETADPQLNESRRLAVREFLAQQGLDLPQESIVVGYPAAAGLDGVTAEHAARKSLQGSRAAKTSNTTPMFGPWGGYRGGDSSSIAW